MFGSLSEEVEVQVPAEKAWDLYGTIKIGDIAAKHILESLDVIEGDGGVGTILKLTFKPGKRLFTRVSLTYCRNKHAFYFVFCWLSRYVPYFISNHKSICII